MRMSGGATNVGLVIEGGALAVCLAEFNQDAFLAMCKACKAVVCCRVSPMQKAQVSDDILCLPLEQGALSKSLLSN